MLKSGRTLHSKKKNGICPLCGFLIVYDPTLLQFSLLKKVFCAQCSESVRPKTTKQGRSESQNRSRDQEKRAAKNYGGKRQAGSGSSWRAKGDVVKAGEFCCECKTTSAKSHSLKLETLLKLKKEARGMEAPLYEVEFSGVSPAQRFVVVPAEEYRALLNTLEEYRELE